jgi:hypothetical protein
MRIPLTTGAYEARSLVAEAQRCVNLYMEKNPPDAQFPFTCYPTPGLDLLATAEPTEGSGWRQLWFASNNKFYGVCGNTVFAISESWALTPLGNIASTSGYVSMTDNGNYVVIVDGSNRGWTIKLADDSFALISDSAFLGGNTVGFVDGYLVFNSPGTNEWYVSLVNEVSFDALDFASKSGYSDLLAGVGVAKRYVYLFGQQTTEVWFDAGDTPFPFNRLPGVFMQFGCASPGSIAQMDGNLYWLAQSPQGKAMVVRSQQFNAEQISTFALDNEMQGYSDLDQAIGFTYQLDGHFFYVLIFPESDKTWQYDLSTQQWNELIWIDGNGQEHRHRANCYANAYGMSVVGDWQNGKLYHWNQNTYTDEGNPIPRIRSFMHGVDEASNRIHYMSLIANMEVGNGIGTNVDVPVFLRWSDTRGVSFGNAVQRSMGREGQYLTSIQWTRLGMARDRVFEISWSSPVKTALLGAWVEAQSNNQ